MPIHIQNLIFCVSYAMQTQIIYSVGKVFQKTLTSSLLKVVGNEKEGGSGKWQMIDIGLGLW
jgi:hypothetical protein